MHGVVTQQTTKWSVHYPEIQLFSAACTLRCIYWRFQKLTPGSATCSHFYLKCVCLLLSGLFLSVSLRRTEETASAGETCLRPSLLWDVVQCTLAVGYLHKRSSEMGPTCTETSLNKHPTRARGSTTPRRNPDVTSVLYPGGAWFEFRMGRRLSWLKIFRDCGEWLEGNCWYVGQNTRACFHVRSNSWPHRWMVRSVNSWQRCEPFKCQVKSQLPSASIIWSSPYSPR